MATSTWARTRMSLYRTLDFATAPRVRHVLIAAPLVALGEGASGAASRRSPATTTTYAAPNAGETGLSGSRPSQGPPRFTIKWTEGNPPPGPSLEVDDMRLGGAAVTDPAIQAEAADAAVKEAEERAEESLAEPEGGARGAEESSCRGGGGCPGGEVSVSLASAAAEGRGSAGAGTAQKEKAQNAPACSINILLDIPVD